MRVRTHTFKLGKYHIDQEDYIEGLCDLPDEYQKLHMIILQGNDVRGLSSTIHEAMHAEGVPGSYLDGERDASLHVDKFLWRLGS